MLLVLRETQKDTVKFHGLMRAVLRIRIRIFWSDPDPVFWGADQDPYPGSGS
jgi:hypothetical protein